MIPRKPEPSRVDRVAGSGTNRAPVILDVQTILAGQTEVRLLHRDAEYRLRVTRQGKLILTK